MKKLTTIKGLSFFKAYTEEESIYDDDLISFKDLYKNDIMDFKAWGISSSPKDVQARRSIQPSNFYPREQIDEQGYYKEPESNWRKNFMAEAILEEKQKITLPDWLALHRGV